MRVYHVNVPPTIAASTYMTAGAAYNWSTSASIPLSDSQCVAVGWSVEDSDSSLASIASVVLSLPTAGSLFAYMPDGSGIYIYIRAS